ncbi:arylesterase [Actibacterium sp. MT2.3-13A]|uniref:arylesterase n=1 Tax=Actibacterium sp. MT2.3-13A TaxID=2828332 RepID=UPI0032C22AA3
MTSFSDRIGSVISGLRSWASLLRYGALRRAGKLAALATVTIAAAPALAGPVTIAALGDSLTQGYGLIEQDGFVPQLQDWLRARGEDVLVINAGVSGDTTAGGLSRVGWTLEDPRVAAMIVALGGNDLLRGIDPDVSRANLKGILEAAQAKDVPVLLVGLNAPGNYGPDYKAAFDALYPELAGQFGALYYPSFFNALNAHSDDPGAMAKYLQPDGIHPNDAGVALIVEDMGPMVLDLIGRTR